LINMALFKGKQINAFSVYSKLSDLDFSDGAKRLLEHWGMFTIGDLYTKGNLYLNKYRGFGLLKIDEICLVRDFLDSVIHLDFPFENCVEHQFAIPMCPNCMFNQEHMNLPLSQILDQCYSPFCNNTLAELVENKRSKKHSMLELIEINLLLLNLSERYKCDSLRSDDVELSGDRFSSSLELEEYLFNALNELHESHREVLLHRFGVGEYEAKTLEQIGKMYNLTRERIRQIERKALKKFVDKILKDRKMIFNSIDPIYFGNQHNIVDLVIDYAITENAFSEFDHHPNVYVKSKLIVELEENL
jgi:RNA polymerase sigma factor (sigma-70 family)